MQDLICINFCLNTFMSRLNHLGYSLIGNGFCSVNGVDPTSCYEYPVSSLSDCEAACSSYEPCVGYYYSAEIETCHLVPSEASCPTGYITIIESITAASSSDLEVDVSDERNVYDNKCYGKN